jgi:predicted phage terminase large subunit-like protein
MFHVKHFLQIGPLSYKTQFDKNFYKNLKPMTSTSDVESERLKLEYRLAQLQAQERATSTFLDFCRYVWPEMIVGEHHRRIALALDRVVSGECKRLMIAMPPRHGKSQMGSYLFPAYLMGKMPQSKLIVGSHTAELAQRFGRMIRNLVSEERYKELFPEMALSADSKAAGRWDTSQGGEAFFIGKGGAMTGRGGNVVILDDILDEQDAMSDTAMENTWDWYTSGPRQRLQPNGSIIVINTRWRTDDLSGRLLKQQGQLKTDQWELLEFPAILPNNKPLWPEYWKLEELEKVKMSIGLRKWQAQWQQQPTSEEGAILKREWWKIWPHDDPPACDYLIQSYDTAYSKKETADYSVITTWGVFVPDQDSGPNIVLLDVKRGRWDFPELKRIAKAQHDYWKPDNILIEAKATGVTLQQELRRMGIPVTMYNPGGRRAGQDKVSRAHSVAPLFESGMVWVPETDWAEELVEECAAFPNGDNDDMVDSTTQAMMRFRSGNFISLADDDDEDTPSDALVHEYY